MSDNVVAPVVAGLAMGVGFIVLFSFTFNSVSLPAVKISEEQAVKIGVQDLTAKYIRNPEAIKIYALVDDHDGAYVPIDSLGKEGNLTHTLVYSEPDGTFHLVNVETHSTVECQVPYCPLPEQGMKSMGGRLAWIVDLISRCENFPSNTTVVIYAIDAETGEIIWHYGGPQLEQAYVCS